MLSYLLSMYLLPSFLLSSSTPDTWNSSSCLRKPGLGEAMLLLALTTLDKRNYNPSTHHTVT